MDLVVDRRCLSIGHGTTEGEREGSPRFAAVGTLLLAHVHRVVTVHQSNAIELTFQFRTETSGCNRLP